MATTTAPVSTVDVLDASPLDGERDPLGRHREGQALGEEAVDAGGGLQIVVVHD